MVGTTHTLALSYKLEFHWRWKFSGCKALVKKFAFQICSFFSQTCAGCVHFFGCIEDNVLIICLCFFLHG
jgi:hypothetical protein